MNKELIISVKSGEIQIALVEDKQLVEFSKEKSNTGFSVGDIYLGKVKKIMPGLNASFVNIGHEKDAFIHYLNLGPNFATLHKAINSTKSKGNEFIQLQNKQTLKRDGKISQVISSGQNILVQIAKEAISTKGPRLTADISIAGRHVVLLPLVDKISISQKIKANDERKRLKKIAENALPPNYGLIIRTAALGKENHDLEQEIKSLVKKWEHVYEKARTEDPPVLLANEINRTTAILRDLLSVSFSNIYVDDDITYEEIKEYIRTIEPGREKIVKLYKGNTSIFDNFDITKQIKSSFGKTISFKRGAYMIIEHTEALHVIDINSGKRAKVADNQEETAVEVNLNAVSEIARQLRLRDMGGIIVIDFIDMHQAGNKQLIYEKMRDAMSTDRAKHTILPLTKFGLMQITRQRVRPETHIETSEVCPTCNGSGKITPSILLTEKIENAIGYYSKEKNAKFLEVHLHSFVAAFICCGFFSLRMKWMLKYKCFIKIVPEMSLVFMKIKIFDKSKTELE
ncbi:MAG: Rne/Rng family ribonuclease [Rikenellaceae bacterium]|nr:Rne/Rng family ribonuclease [Rikenellaceae bacterium]